MRELIIIFFVAYTVCTLPGLIYAFTSNLHNTGEKQSILVYELYKTSLAMVVAVSLWCLSL